MIVFTLRKFGTDIPGFIAHRGTFEFLFIALGICAFFAYLFQSSKDKKGGVGSKIVFALSIVFTGLILWFKAIQHDLVPHGFLDFLLKSGFMMMAVYLLIACIIIQVTISLVSPAGESDKASKLYWNTPWEPLQDKGWPLFGNYKFLAALLIVIMCILYYIFR